MGITSKIAETETSLTDAQVNEVVAQSLPTAEYAGKKVLLIVPDHTRSAPVGQLFKAIHAQFGGATAKLDVMIALGTHPPMSEEAICERLEISPDERRGQFAAHRLAANDGIDFPLFLACRRDDFAFVVIARYAVVANFLGQYSR